MPRRAAAAGVLDREPKTGVDSAPPPKRINVAVNSQTFAAIESVIEAEQISLTEAVRRLLNLGYFVYEAIKDQGSTLILRGPDGQEREVVLL